MKKILARLAIIATLVLVGVGFTSGTASAANCTVTHGQTGWQASGNWLYFGAQLTNCVNVDMAEMYRTSGSDCTGWRDISNGTSHCVPLPPNPDDVLFGRQYTTLTSAGWTWYVHPWCGGFTHVVYTEFIYRIHNRVTNSWGQWYYTLSPNYAIVC